MTLPPSHRAVRLALMSALVSASAGCEGHAEPRPEDATIVRERGATLPRSTEPEPGAQLVPVVVELFSSEGCSSCPPADRVLAELASKQTIPGARILPLELHVDYWNDLGWVDPFSAEAYSDRQRAYAALASRGGVYTPEVVVDGEGSLVGSDASAIADAIGRAARRPHVTIGLARHGDAIDATLGAAVPGASLWIAVTESGLETHVPSGENRGATLRHAPVVRAFERVGAAHEGTSTLRVPRVRDAHGPLAATVLVQMDEARAILGAARIDLAAE